jgi:hypothetical protein
MDTDRIIAAVGETLHQHGDDLNRVYLHMTEMGLQTDSTRAATVRVRQARDACWTSSCELLDLAREGVPIA